MTNDKRTSLPKQRSFSWARWIIQIDEWCKWMIYNWLLDPLNNLCWTLCRDGPSFQLGPYSAVVHTSNWYPLAPYYLLFKTNARTHAANKYREPKKVAYESAAYKVPKKKRPLLRESAGTPVPNGVSQEAQVTIDLHAGDPPRSPASLLIRKLPFQRLVMGDDAQRPPLLEG
jgi:hypothetical protein